MRSWAGAGEPPAPSGSLVSGKGLILEAGCGWSSFRGDCSPRQEPPLPVPWPGPSSKAHTSLKSATWSHFRVKSCKDTDQRATVGFAFQATSRQLGGRSGEGRGRTRRPETEARTVGQCASRRASPVAGLVNVLRAQEGAMQQIRQTLLPGIVPLLQISLYN